MAQNLRLFIAIELPETNREPIHRMLRNFQQAIPRRTVRWVNTENLHLTLKFLGDTPVNQVDHIGAVLHDAVKAHRPFNIDIVGAGCFPNHRKPRVIWLGLHDESGQLTVLHQTIEEHIVPFGFPTEKRSFKPHLTMGRVKRQVSRQELAQIGDHVQQTNIGKLTTWPCRSVRLMQSDLTSQGAVYTCLVEAKLAGG